MLPWYICFTFLVNHIGTAGVHVDVSFAIRQRLDELGLEQKGLARAARVTESYVSQLLTRKKAPPAPNRTDIYDKMDKFLKLPAGELAKVAGAQRKQELKRELGGRARPAVPGSPGLDPAQMRPQERSARPRDLREAALRRARAPGDREAARRGEAREPGGTGERRLASQGGAAGRPQLRGDARHRARVSRYRRLPCVRRTLRLVPGSADRLLGRGPRDLRAGHHP